MHQTQCPISFQGPFQQATCLCPGLDLIDHFFCSLFSWNWGKDGEIVTGPFGEFQSSSSAYFSQLLHLTDCLSFTWDCFETIVNIELVTNGAKGLRSSFIFIVISCHRNPVFCPGLTGVATRPPPDSEEIHILFRYPYLMEHSFNVPHYSYWFLTVVGCYPDRMKVS